MDIDQTAATKASPITLYAIDPSNGESTTKVVKGASGFVVSFVMHKESGKLLMALGKKEAASFSFYMLDLSSGVAVLLGMSSMSCFFLVPLLA